MLNYQRVFLGIQITLISRIIGTMKFLINRLISTKNLDGGIRQRIGSTPTMTKVMVPSATINPVHNLQTPPPMVPIDPWRPYLLGYIMATGRVTKKKTWKRAAGLN